MKFSVALPTDHHDDADELVTGDAIAELSQAAERCGFDAVFVTDHPAPDTKWLSGGGHHALEPTVALAVAAAVTSRIRMHTHVYVLAYRNPFLAAKALASLDRVAGGRVILGIAAGYLRAEFDSVGVPFEERNDRLDRALVLMRRLWAGEEVAGEESGWKARGVQQLPVPVTPGGPTIWIGGNSVAAMTRAARAADGWSPFPTAPVLSRTAKTADISSVELLADRIDRFRRACDDARRDSRLDVCFGAFGQGRYHRGEASADELVDEYAQLQSLGVTWSACGMPGTTRAEIIDRMERFSDEIIRPLADL